MAHLLARSAACRDEAGSYGDRLETWQRARRTCAAPELQGLVGEILGATRDMQRRARRLEAEMAHRRSRSRGCGPTSPRPSTRPTPTA